MRNVIPLLIYLAAIVASAPASAELYKWVDERGVTNYSNEPPPAAAAANKLARVENKVSVYTPDENLLQAVKTLRERTLKALAEPEPARSPVARIATPQTGYEQCLMSGRLGCDDLYRTYAPTFLPAAAVFPLRGVQPTRIFTPRPPAAPSGGTRVSRASPVR